MCRDKEYDVWVKKRPSLITWSYFRDFSDFYKSTSTVVTPELRRNTPNRLRALVAEWPRVSTALEWPVQDPAIESMLMCLKMCEDYIMRQNRDIEEKKLPPEEVEEPLEFEEEGPAPPPPPPPPPPALPAIEEPVDIPSPFQEVKISSMSGKRIDVSYKHLIMYNNVIGVA